MNPQTYTVTVRATVHEADVPLLRERLADVEIMPDEDDTPVQELLRRVVEFYVAPNAEYDELPVTWEAMKG